MKKTLLIFAVFLTVSCHGVFESLYDNGKETASVLDIGFNNSEKFSGVVYLDCRDYLEWIFLDLDTKAVSHYPVPDTLTGEWDGISGWTFHDVDVKNNVFTERGFRKTDAQPKPEKWHFAIHHFDVMTFGAGVFETSYKSLSDLPPSSSAFENETFVYDELTDNQAIVDRTQMLSYYIGYQKIALNRVLSGWATMDFSNPPPTYASSGHVYILKFPDGKFCALLLDDFKAADGTKGFMTMSYIYPY